MYTFKDSPLYQLFFNGKKHVLPKGQSINFDRDHIAACLVIDGFIKRYIITSDGSESVQVLYGKDDVLPLTSVYKITLSLNINPSREITYYDALTKVTIFTISKKELTDALEADESLYKDLLYVSSLRLKSNIQRLENMSLQVANRKVAHQLLYYGNHYGIQTDDGIKIPIPLTHQTLADILNLARETVTLALDRLKEKDILTSEKKLIIIKDKAKLEKAI